MLKVEPQDEKNILEILRSSGILMESPCNGKGLCGKCKIRILEGDASEVTDQEKKILTAEELQSGIRLACLTVPRGEIRIDAQGLLEEKPNNVLRGGELPDVTFEPVIRLCPVDVEKPTLENGWSLCDALGAPLTEAKNLPLHLLQKLPGLMDADKLWCVYHGDELVDLRRDNQAYGLAVDIGTTTVAVVLMNLNTGKVCAEDGFVNPQKAFGLDVLSRIHYDSETPGGIDNLQKAIVQRIQKSAQTMTKTAGIPIDAIYEVVVGGNSTMLHALLGVPMSSLGVSPYSSVFTRPVTVQAEELGFALNQMARLYCIPSVSTYIGGDIVSGVLASRIDRAEDTVLFVDIGTNGEIVLSRKGNMYSCSCAAGPALEGMNISCGMRAEPGAVEHVVLEDDKVTLGIIGNTAPKGLCGSGLLEAVSQAVGKGIINRAGRVSGNSIFTDLDENGKRRIVLDEKNGIYLTQNDIRQVQFCKGAILSGIITLMDELKLEEQDIDRVIVAGQFGKHLNPESLTGAQLIPSSLGDRISYIGNSSMVGAQLCLINGEERRHAEQIAKNIEYIELSVSSGYEKRFTKCLQFGGK